MPTVMPMPTWACAGTDERPLKHSPAISVIKKRFRNFMMMLIELLLMRRLIAATFREEDSKQLVPITWTSLNPQQFKN